MIVAIFVYFIGFIIMIICIIYFIVDSIVHRNKPDQKDTPDDTPSPVHQYFADSDSDKEKEETLSEEERERQELYEWFEEIASAEMYEDNDDKDDDDDDFFYYIH